jgi:hypothetical protein
VESLRRDLVFALRLLRRDLSYTTTVVLTLAICLGANAAIFTVVRSVLLRPLPYADPDRLVFLYDGFPGAGVARAGMSVPNFIDRAAMTGVFEAVGLYRTRGFDAGSTGAVERLTAQQVTPSFFRALGVAPLHGRIFSEDEAQEGKGKVVVVSHAYWTTTLGGRENAIGQDLRRISRFSIPRSGCGYPRCSVRKIAPRIHGGARTTTRWRAWHQASPSRRHRRRSTRTTSASSNAPARCGRSLSMPGTTPW